MRRGARCCVVAIIALLAAGAAQSQPLAGGNYGCNWHSVSFASPLTSNQQAVAGSLNDARGTSDLRQLIGALDTLSDDQAHSALDNLGGEIYANLARVSLTVASGMLRTIASRIGGLNMASTIGAAGYASGLKTAYTDPWAISEAGQPCAPQAVNTTAPSTLGLHGFWMQMLGTSGSALGDGNAPGYGYGSQGMMLGYERALAGGTVLGASLAYTKTSVTLDSGGSGSFDSPQFATYGKYTSGSWAFKGVVDYTTNQYQAERTIAFGDTIAQAQGSYGAQQWSAYAEAAYDWPLYGFSVQPVAALSWVNLEQDGFTESGAGEADLAVLGGTTNTLTSALGARVTRSFSAGNGSNGTLELRAYWTPTLTDTETHVASRFAEAPDSPAFTVASTQPSRNAALFGAGFTAQMWKNLSLHVDYNTTLSSSESSQTVTAGMQYTW
jgi:outer membrane autotransporter protein